MDHNNPILNEIMAISPVVAGIGNQVPYEAPAGYFDALATQIMLKIAVDEKKGNDPDPHFSKENPYQVPAGYFDGLSDIIMSRIKTEDASSPQEELEWLSPLLGRAQKINPFSFPEGYFNDFSENMVSGVKALDFVNEELENLSPIMNSLRHVQVYTVPEGYFDQSAAAILASAKQQPGRVVSMHFGKKMIRYAVAAVVLGAIAIAGYLYSGSKPTNIAPVSELAKVSDQEIENFLNSNTASVADTTTLAIPENGNADIDSKDLLANISDEELQQYVDQRPQTPITN